MIYAFQIKLGWCCPKCGRGKMRVTCGVGHEDHQCPKCSFFERLFR